MEIRGVEDPSLHPNSPMKIKKIEEKVSTRLLIKEVDLEFLKENLVEVEDSITVMSLYI